MAEYTESERDLIIRSLAAGMTPGDIGRRLEGTGGRSATAIERTAYRIREQFASELKPEPAPSVAEEMHRVFGGTFPDLSKSPERPRAPHRFEMDEPPPVVRPPDESPAWKYACEFARKTAPPDESTHIVGVIGDTHLPFELPNYLQFCQETFAKWGVDTVVHIGDLVDNHAMSYHEHWPDGLSPGHEVTEAMTRVQNWAKAFPRLRWVSGNHDKLPARKLRTAGLPARVMRRNIYEIPTAWDQAESYMIDGVLYTHGLGSSGENGARNLARRRSVSCVVGHYHRAMGVAYTPSHDGGNLFGLQVGCGVDHNSYAMEYSRDFGRMALGCGIVRHGVEAYSIPMLRGQWQGVAK